MTCLNPSMAPSGNNLITGSAKQLLIIFFFLIISQVTPVLAKEYNYPKVDQIETYSTLQVELSFKLNADTNLIVFLLENMDLTCTLIRHWELENFKAKQVKENIYRANDGAGLKGTLYKHFLSDTGALFSGRGTINSRRLPFTLDGSAVARIQWEKNENQLHISPQLSIKVENTFFHLMAKLLYPIVKGLSNDKAERLISVAKELTENIHNHPNEARLHLEKVNSRMAKKWVDFHASNP